MEPIGELPPFVFPEPDDTNDPNSSFTLTAAKARQFRALLTALSDYIQTQYARCGKETPTTP